ncbi:MAG: hypothetical protein GY820_00575 [Gammaproteobacteria bacterium]|nr:hypothetical protein [Gammaproteobacteria bacterium]
MIQETKEEFDELWEQFRFRWGEDYGKAVRYLEKNIIDTFQKFSSIWRLQELNVENINFIGTTMRIQRNLLRIKQLRYFRTNQQRS